MAPCKSKPGIERPLDPVHEGLTFTHAVGIAPHAAAEPLQVLPKDPPMVGIDPKPQEPNAVSDRMDLALSWMRREAKLLERTPYLLEPVSRRSPVRRHEHEVVHVSHVAAHAEALLHEPVHRIQVVVGEELAREISDGEPPGPTPVGFEGEVGAEGVLGSGIVPSDERDQQIVKPRIPVEPAHLAKQDLVIDGEEVFSDVHLHHPRTPAQKVLKAVQRPVGPLSDATGIGIVDEVALHQRLELSADGVVHDSVPVRCGPDLPLLRMLDRERTIPTEVKCTGPKLGLKAE